MTACPYCQRRQGVVSLREHVAVNGCGKVPAGTCLPYQPAELASVVEKDHAKMARKVARTLGWKTNHNEPLQGRDGRWLTSCSPGFPDDVMVHPCGRLLVVEFKRHKHRTAPKLAALQGEWLAAFASVPGVAVMQSGPADWPTLQRALTSVPALR